jgi:hypothetical protein
MAREGIFCQAGTLFSNARRSKDLEWNVGEKVRMGNDLGLRIHKKEKAPVKSAFSQLNKSMANESPPSGEE